MSSKKSIFLETHNLKNPATGFGTFNYELIKGLSMLNFENFELHINAEQIKQLKDEFGNKFEYNKYRSFHRYKNLRPFSKYDLWHSVNQNTKIEPRYKTKYLLTVHDINFMEEISSDMNHNCNKLFIEKLNKASAITYISDYARKQTHEFFKVPNVPEYVIHNGNPISSFLDTSSYIPNVPVDKPFLYTIGDFIERKNYESIIKMIKNIKDFNLIISGNNNKHYGEVIKALIISEGLENQVFLTGRVSDVGKQFYLKNCTAFLFPSLREGFGLPPVEAMSFGKPIFLSNKTSLPEVGGDAAYYWEDFDSEYMKTILLEGLNDYDNNPNKKIQIIEKGKSFDWVETASEYVKVYNDILY
ncbi:glycosyltransferase family 4 protein [Flavobacterium sp. 7A]|uniref:glycosyltransferase family 4 protein n=1 Tax=Flavobacterium sp. 7A TaxID=2940571 RepID=UPI0022265605|nr:glycosyltransferase family 1 protein [Flavobacterium sp. 7A]MCW2119227.1 glycosyltransferase involved in cell wall biosynthesis [Flavobacterium sp. 7A]